MGNVINSCSSTKAVSVLTNDDVRFLMQNTRYTEKEIRDWYKGFQEDCPTGKLTRAKFIEIYQMFFQTGHPEEFCSHVFRTFDADGDELIDFKEFLLAVGITTGNDSREKLKWAFKMYDINRDGMIEMSEMNKIVNALYQMLGSHALEELDPGEQARRVETIFEKMDTNKDGNVSLEEFMEVCTTDPQLAKLLCITPGAR